MKSLSFIILGISLMLLMTNQQVYSQTMEDVFMMNCTVTGMNYYGMPYNQALNICSQILQNIIMTGNPLGSSPNYPSPPPSTPSDNEMMNCGPYGDCLDVIEAYR